MKTVDTQKTPSAQRGSGAYTRYIRGWKKRYEDSCHIRIDNLRYNRTAANRIISALEPGEFLRHCVVIPLARQDVNHFSKKKALSDQHSKAVHRFQAACIRVFQKRSLRRCINKVAHSRVTWKSVGKRKVFKVAAVPFIPSGVVLISKSQFLNSSRYLQAGQTLRLSAVLFFALFPVCGLR